MIKVKTLFHGWKEISKERAIKVAHTIASGSVNLNSQEKLKCINKRFRGIQFISLEEIFEKYNGIQGEREA